MSEDTVDKEEMVALAVRRSVEDAIIVVLPFKNSSQISFRAVKGRVIWPLSGARVLVGR
jgi:hypothetical protein